MKPPKKKKIVGYKISTKQGKTIQTGTKSKLTMTPPSEKSTYTPSKVETGHSAYGKPGGGTNKEMNRLISDAQAKKRDVTDYSSKGLHYKAGTTTTTKTPMSHNLTIGKPTVRSVEFVKEPIYAPEKIEKKRKVKLSKRGMVAGGTTKGDKPVTNYSGGRKPTGKSLNRASITRKY